MDKKRKKFGIKMPKYLGRGETFWLVTCELVPSPTATKEDKIRVHENMCNKCGFYKDMMKRREEARKNGETWRRLICVHPKNKGILEKLSSHVTVWGR